MLSHTDVKQMVGHTVQGHVAQSEARSKASWADCEKLFPDNSHREVAALEFALEKVDKDSKRRLSSALTYIGCGHMQKLLLQRLRFALFSVVATVYPPLI